MQYIRQRFGAFKLKDKEGRRGQIISNPAGKYLVVKEIIVQKVPGRNNEVVIDLVMPEPEEIEVVEAAKKTEKGLDSPRL